MEICNLQSVRFPAGGQQQFVTRPAPPGTPAASSGSGQTPAQTFPFAPTEASSAVRLFYFNLFTFLFVVFSFVDCFVQVQSAVNNGVTVFRQSSQRFPPQQGRRTEIKLNS